MVVSWWIVAFLPSDRSYKVKGVHSLAILIFPREVKIYMNLLTLKVLTFLNIHLDNGVAGSLTVTVA